ncbi:MAG: MoxR family ATPase [Chloroflexi bacterium]|nr:MoxR family ATPase [Chloroflexota bacterium]MBV9893971.1 MoxR family ATPase [Chloroflexota bacterium]
MSGTQTLRELVAAVETVLIGKHAEAELAIIGLAAAGHLLIEDVPGVGKTMLAKSLARATGCTFKRIQFTPDLLPSDVTGVSIYNQRTGEFEFRAGPIVAHVVLADEINRATPKTQSALLEAMEEHQVTVEGVTRPLPVPFMVLATQNPIEYEGTFPLPEAQLDRFLLRIHLGYPAPADEVDVLQRQMLRHPIEDLGAVTSASELQQLQHAVRSVHVEPQLQRYIVHLVGLTREHPDVYLGGSPRGSLALMRAAQARAMLLGRDYVIPDDVKALAVAALAHRLIMSPEARMRNATASAVISSVLQEVPVPGSRVPA